MIVGIDLETRSCADLKRVSAWAYSLDPSTDVYCAVFGYEDPVHGYREFHWQHGDPVPAVAKKLSSGMFTALAHNSTFERALWMNVLTPKHGWPACPAYFEDTQALAAAANLPTSLAGLGAALGCQVQKDAEGNALMLKMCADKPGKGNSHDTPENRAKLLAYCATDVRTMLQCYERVPKMTPTENKVWALDQEINTRGVRIDRKFVDKLQKMVDQRDEQLQRHTLQDTDWDLNDSVSTPALKTWLKDQGVELPKVLRANGKTSESIGRAIVAEMAEDPELPHQVRLVLESRLEASKVTSLAKLKQVVKLVDPRDERLRNYLQFCAAHTGRWSSRGLQVHNLPKDRREKTEAARVNELIYNGDLKALIDAVPRPLEAMSLALRGMIVASPGHELIGADFSAVEARIIAWLAGQTTVLEAFADPTRDVYVEAAAYSGSISRDYGKLKVLGMGFGMGAVKALAEAPKYKLKDFTGKDAKKAVKDYREANDRIVAFWAACENQVKNAIKTPGQVFEIGEHLKVACNDECLMARLPSGRIMRYWRPSLQWVKKSFEVLDENGEITTTEPKQMEEIRFFTPSKDTRSMQEESTYAGSLAENFTQAVARDLTAAAAYRLNQRGYPVVIHVHDSIASEVPACTGDVGEFCKIMAETPPWAVGLPIAAQGYRDTRFRG